MSYKQSVAAFKAALVEVSRIAGVTVELSLDGEKEILEGNLYPCVLFYRNNNGKVGHWQYPAIDDFFGGLLGDFNDSGHQLLAGFQFTAGKEEPERILITPRTLRFFRLYGVKNADSECLPVFLSELKRYVVFERYSDEGSVGGWIHQADNQMEVAEAIKKVLVHTEDPGYIDEIIDLDTGMTYKYEITVTIEATPDRIWPDREPVDEGPAEERSWLQ